MYVSKLTTDVTNKKPSEIGNIKWKYQEKPRDSNLQNFNLIEKADNINFDDDINNEKGSNLLTTATLSHPHFQTISCKLVPKYQVRSK